MAEHEYKIWEALARVESVEGERDRAITEAKQSNRRNLVIAMSGIVATLIAGTIPLMCSSKPERALAPINEIKVYPPPQAAPIVNVQVLPAPAVIQPASGAKK